MFNSKHYVPILKWKRAEQGALAALDEKDKKLITPLIQLVMLNQKPDEKLEDLVARFEEHVSLIPEEIIAVWGKSPVFIDVSLLFTTPLKAKSFAIFMREGVKLGASFIPVIHLNDESEIIKAASLFAKNNKSGICLRLVCPNLSDPTSLKENISVFLSHTKLGESDIDLLIDIKEIEAEDENKYAKYFDLSQKIPSLSKWRTYIFASGAYPEDLSECKLDELNLLPRLDWKNWMEHHNNNTTQRKPAFADYTIQYPIYKEATQFFPPTSSIKYTLENEWLIMKGRKQDYKLYLANARILADSKYFYKAGFSYGDNYIAEKAKHYDAYMKDPKIKGTGSTETWIKAGINHHLTLVARKISSLS